MSNPSFDTYKQHYSKFIDIVAQYHNRHQDFSKNLSEIAAQDCKRMLRQLRALEKEMLPLIWDAYLVNKKGLKEVRKAQRAARERKKAHPPPNNKAVQGENL